MAIWVFADLNPQNPQTTFMAGIIVWMSTWWVMEVIPLGVTALLPIVLFPIFEILPTKEIAPFYAKDTVFIFIGGFLVAFAMEKWNLHKRIAFKLISLTGQSPSQILLGFMLSSWLLSMWISNTATTVMLLPTAIAVIQELELQSKTKLAKKFYVGLLLSIAYSSSIGGVATMIGSPPNLLFIDFYHSQADTSFHFTFLNWMLFGLPLSLCFIIISYFFFKYIFCRIDLVIDKGYFKEKNKSLGPIGYEEKIVLIVFILLALCWMTRQGVDLGFLKFNGWGHWFSKVNQETGETIYYVKDSSVAILFSIVLFVLPSKKSNQRIIGIKELQRLPINIIFLFGGGFALSKGFTVSGLGNYLADQLNFLSGQNIYIIIFLITAFVIFLTEVSSNAATIILIQPVLWAIAPTLGIDPLMLLIPATFACSFAFMLPISTPPNAVVMESNRITIKQMVRTGLWLNIIGLAIIMTFLFTLGPLIFKF